MNDHATEGIAAAARTARGCRRAAQATRDIKELIEERVSPEPNTGCWLWLGVLERNGYGRLRLGEHRWAHRAAYTAFVGPIPVGLEIDHRCRVRSCANPTHLDVVTRRENMARKPRPSACPAGHAYTPENTYSIERRTRFRSRPERRCRICALARAKGMPAEPAP